MSSAPGKKQDRRPPYQHAADELRRDIEQGRFRAGQQMPSIRELQERFGVANMTARNALNLLREEGLIYTIHGRGSFVADVGVQEGGSEINYEPPAWYLRRDGDGPGQEGAGEGRPDGGSAAPSLAEVLTSLRDEIRTLSVEQQELRREVEELKQSRQSDRPS